MKPQITPVPYPQTPHLGRSSVRRAERRHMATPIRPPAPKIAQRFDALLLLALFASACWMLVLAFGGVAQ